MSRSPAWLLRYLALPKALYLFAAGQFLINLIGSAQFLLLNLFLKERGLDDPQIAALGSNRFVATFLFAIPAGLWLRGRPLRWPMLIATLAFPASALVGLETARLGHLHGTTICFLLMGLAGLVLNVTGLPMMLRLTPKEQTSEAMSLLFSTWAASAICSGALSSLLQYLGQINIGSMAITLDVHATLLILTLAGFGAPLLYLRLPEAAPLEKLQTHWLHVRREDRARLLGALLPSILMATGAGLSIQFMNLFFSHVHGLSPANYAFYGTVSHVFVLFAGLMVPEVRRRFGWRGAIIGVQTIAVVLLAVMGLTELWRDFVWSLPLAIVLFIFRQPLMSMAGPATSELTMQYVGSRNHELVSACNGAIWSGAWWLAARFFEVLRGSGLPYWQVFLTTSVLYLFGTFAYLRLIRDVEKSPP
ncbi:MAG: MFS transporter [Verrucomicrobiales bacterium]